MEKLMYHVWRNRLMKGADLTTIDGKPVEILDTGMFNRDAGPDFFNAKIKIGGTTWVGNVEMHEKASHWYAHHHDGDRHYDNVILHVVLVNDRIVNDRNGNQIPQLVMHLPQDIKERYDALLKAKELVPCHETVREMKKIHLRSWLATLQTERLEQKTDLIFDRLKRCDGSWEQVLFMSLAQGFGFGINAMAFEQWALSIPLSMVGHHRDDLFQIESLFIGNAGLLSTRPALNDESTAKSEDEYQKRQRDEYHFLAHKFGLQPIDPQIWRFMRLRPQNFPYIRLAQLAKLYCQGTAELSHIIACQDIKQIKDALRTDTSDYWQTHYVYGKTSRKSTKKLSEASLDSLIINVITPILFAYGRYRSDEKLCEKAINLLENMPPEDNHIIRFWHSCGYPATHAADTQGLIQLQKKYCDKKDCIRCRIGHEYLKSPKR